MRTTRKLTERQIRVLKPAERPYKVADGEGLYLFVVTPAGGRPWRLKYRYGGKEKRLSLGPWHGVALEQARALTPATSAPWSSQSRRAAAARTRTACARRSVACCATPAGRNSTSTARSRCGASLASA